jgi:hypothetical protein
MKTELFTIEFSLRDWRKGSELLESLGFNDKGDFSNLFSLELTEDDSDFLLEELQETSLEFTLTNFETGQRNFNTL